MVLTLTFQNQAKISNFFYIWNPDQNRAQIGADRSGLVLIRCSDRYIMIDTASNMLIDQFVQTSSCLNNLKYHNQQDKEFTNFIWLF